ncbi:MAG: hypothetical protein U5K37_07365 [Natrialbaceae archaeon]|nr:hypothetical protein [Natrialbaceae archaeon]
MTESDAIETLEDLRNRVRTEPRYMAVGLAVAVVIGVLLAFVHWFGLVIGGALVGLVSRSLPVAIASAVGFGVVVIVVFVATLGEPAATVTEMQPIVFITLGAPIGLPVIGSLIRGIV